MFTTEPVTTPFGEGDFWWVTWEKVQPYVNAENELNSMHDYCPDVDPNHEEPPLIRARQGITFPRMPTRCCAPSVEPWVDDGCVAQQGSNHTTDRSTMHQAHIHTSHLAASQLLRKAVC